MIFNHQKLYTFNQIRCTLSIRLVVHFVPEYSGDYIVRVIFAGIYTGFLEDNGNRIFTGDVVDAKILDNPIIPSVGGIDRAKDNVEFKSTDCTYQAGVSNMFGNYSLIFDNHSVPISWATELHIIGSLFYDLSKNDTELDINSLCNGFAQSHQDRNELQKIIKKSPNFTPTTWQEKAIELLCGNKNNTENQ